MANDFSRNVDILFENIGVGFDAMNIAAKNITMFRPNVGRLAQGGQTFYRPMPMQTKSVDGRDISAAYKDLTELTVPATLTESHLRNVPVKLTGVDLNDPRQMDNIVLASVVELSNRVDTLVMDKVANYGTQVVINSGNIDTYDDAAEAGTIMTEQQISAADRVMLLNPRMGQNLAGNLAGRGTLSGIAQTAYEKAQLPDIARFSVFQTDYGTSITGSSGSGYLVNGADQNTTPVAKDANDLPVDNRTQTLTVDTGANAAVGDAFTIAGVYSVGHINNQSTSQLKTFRITAINGADWTIAPAIIPADGADDAQAAYANVDTTPADNAAITILNTTTKPASVFYSKPAVEFVTAEFDTDLFAATGKKVRKMMTDSGVELIMLADSDIDVLTGSFRLFIWGNPELMNYEHGGIMLEGQV